jgi:hypothetical protein
MSPLLVRIQESAWVKREIEQSELSLATAKTSLEKRHANGEIAKVLKEDQVRGAKILADGRSRSSVVPTDGDASEEGTGHLAEQLADGNKPSVKRSGSSRTGARVRREHTM